MLKYKRTSVIYEFKNGMEPIATLPLGRDVLIETNDCFCQQIQDERQVFSGLDFARVNPATGPFYIEGAQVGDLLAITIKEIDLASQGVAGTMAGGGLLGDKIKKDLSMLIPIENNRSSFLQYRVPVHPMIGVIGLSPGPDLPSFPTAVPYKHGGNMDTTEISQGHTLYLPVREEGAYFAVGDVHANMGDGEISLAALEIPARLTLSFDLIKGHASTWPILETKYEMLVIASGKTVEEAAQEAALEMIHVVQRDSGCSFEEAYIFNSLYVDYRISQVVNELKTVRAALAKDIISRENFLQAFSD